jgi:hypothetical protein
MSSTLSHRIPNAQDDAIASLTGYETQETLRWQSACVQAANTLTALPNGRYVQIRMERMRQGLELAQRGAVSLPEDGEQLTAVVRSGNNIYSVDTRLLSCTCADNQKSLQTCKHILATEVHIGALGLSGLAEEPLNPPTVPVGTPDPEPALTTSLPAPAPTAAAWPTSEAPASMNVKLRVGSMELMYTARDTNDRDLQDRMTKLLPWLAEVMAACEANYEARQQEAERTRQGAAAAAGAQAEEERKAGSRAEEVTAAAEAARQAQTKASANGHSQPAAPEAQAQRTAAQHANDAGWCPKHQVPMKWRAGNARGPGWFSHQLTDGSYCKGKVRRESMQEECRDARRYAGTP